MDGICEVTFHHQITGDVVDAIFSSGNLEIKLRIRDSTCTASTRHTQSWSPMATLTLSSFSIPTLRYSSLYGPECKSKMNVHLKEWALTPKPGFIYRTIGGILDMYFFLGPTPSESASQYAQAVGE